MYKNIKNTKIIHIFITTTTILYLPCFKHQIVNINTHYNINNKYIVDKHKGTLENYI